MYATIREQQTDNANEYITILNIAIGNR